MNWFALTVKPQHEKAAEMQLHFASMEAYCPVYRSRRKWSDRTKTLEVPLFRGYVFCRFDGNSRRRVLEMPSVTSVVGFGGKPEPVSDSEIAAVKAMVDSGRPLERWPALRVGQPIRICGGPLAGLSGILVDEKSVLRLVVNVELLNRAVSVEIERDYVEADRRGRPSPLAA